MQDVKQKHNLKISLVKVNYLVKIILMNLDIDISGNKNVNEYFGNNMFQASHE